MSEFGGKAESICSVRVFRILTRMGPGTEAMSKAARAGLGCRIEDSEDSL
jgi:hypothetical protein